MKLLRGIWAWSWVATLPLCLFWGTWAFGTAERYRTFGIEYDTTPMRYPLWETGRDEFLHLVRRMKLAVFPDGLRGPQHDDDLRTISLFVPERNLAELNADLPGSGFEYVKAGIWDGKSVRKAKVRYRGDFARHWAWPKKSWRVKASKSRLFEGLRSFNLIVPKFPEHLNNYLAYRLAHRLGLLTPRVELVHVAVNGRLTGLHVLCEQLEEMTLRSNDCMPGDIYSGDLVAKGSYRGVMNRVFEYGGLWDKAAINNHYPDEHRAPIERLIELVNAYPSEEVQVELNELLDLEAWSRFSAFETLARTFHYDAGHNWRLYYDLNRGKLVPIVWDPVGWANYFRFHDGGAPNLDVVVTRLHSLLFMNGDFLRRRHEILREFFDSGEHTSFLEEADLAVRRTRSALAIDPNVRPLSMDEVEFEMAEFRKSIDETFEQVQRAFLAPTGDVHFASTEDRAGIALSVEGRRPVARLVAHFDGPLPNLSAVALRVLRDGVAVDADVSGAVRVDGQRLEVELGLLPKTTRYFSATSNALTNQELRFHPGYYELRLTGLTPDVTPVEVLVDRGGRTLEAASKVEHLNPADIGALFRVVPERPSYAPLVWRGAIELRGLTELDRDLVIEPGTRVRLAPGASLIARGRLLAEGTPDRPIRFEPLRPGQEPWGAVVVQGAQSAGSRLTHCTFELGSGWKDDLSEYSAMFSVHDTSAARLQSCIFRDSRIVDDMVHVVYADIELVDCTFERSLSDAIDLDICRATVRGCVFRDSGNDAIDLMTSKAVVVDCVFVDSGDKGVSVGEGSTLLAINNRLQRNVIGVQVKDGSSALVYNADFEDNGIAIDAYKKNWRYGDGGKVLVQKSRIVGNEEGVTADKHSRVVVSDSYYDDEPVVDEKGRVVFDDTVDGIEGRVARSDLSDPLPEELTSLEGLATSFWERRNPAARGADLGDG